MANVRAERAAIGGDTPPRRAAAGATPPAEANPQQSRKEDEMSWHPVFRDGRLHVLARRCDTCIFRSGNLMHLAPGRVDGMVAGALANDSVIPCHATIYDPAVQPAVCRGFFARYWRAVAGLRLARFMGLIELDQPPTKASTRQVGA